MLSVMRVCPQFLTRPRCQAPSLFIPGRRGLQPDPAGANPVRPQRSGDHTARRRQETSPMTDPATLLPALEALAIEAGAAIMVIRDRGAAVREKPDSSPVTDADEAAERIIIQGLKSLLPET